jgi:hypothetical protein
MSIFGKEKYLEGQSLQNIGHFQALVFVFHLESRVPKPFVHRCLCLVAQKWMARLHNLLLFRIIYKKVKTLL